MKIRVYPKMTQVNPVGLVVEIIEFGLNLSRRIHYTLLMHLEKKQSLTSI